MRLTIGYSDSEDRLWIRTEASNALWWVTRRIALRLVAQWADVLERSLPDDGAEAADAADSDAIAPGGPEGGGGAEGPGCISAAGAGGRAHD